MTLNRKNNNANVISVHKLVKKEVSHKILGIFCQKLKNQDGRRKSWIYANKLIKEKVYHVIAVWSCDQCSDHVTLNTESPWISHPLLWGRQKWIREPTRVRRAIGKYLTNDDLSRHCGTGERQKYDDLSRHSGTQEVNVLIKKTNICGTGG